MLARQAFLRALSKPAGADLALQCLLVPQHAQKRCCYVQFCAVSSKAGGQTTKTLMAGK